VLSNIAQPSVHTVDIRNLGHRRNLGQSTAREEQDELIRSFSSLQTKWIPFLTVNLRNFGHLHNFGQGDASSESACGFDRNVALKSRF